MARPSIAAIGITLVWPLAFESRIAASERLVGTFPIYGKSAASVKSSTLGLRDSPSARQYLGRALGHALLGATGRARDLRIKGNHGGAQALGDDLCVVLQSRLGVRMPEVALHILDRPVVLHVRG